MGKAEMEIKECQAVEFNDIVSLMQTEHCATRHLAPEYLEGFLRAVDENGHLVGVIGSQWYPPLGIVTSLAISSETERPRIARLLNQKLEQWFIAHNVDELYILCTSDIELLALGYELVDYEEEIPTAVFDCLHNPDFDCQKPYFLGIKKLAANPR